MKPIQLGTIPRTFPFGWQLVGKPVTLSWDVIRRHVCVLSEHPGSDVVTAIALTCAKQVAEAGGRVLVIDALDDDAERGRLHFELMSTFPEMESWQQPDTLEEQVSAHLDESPDSPAAYIFGPAASSGSNGLCAGIRAVRAHTINRLASPLSENWVIRLVPGSLESELAETLSGTPEEEGDVPVIYREVKPALLIVRGASIGSLGPQLSAAHVAVLYLGDGQADPQFVMGGAHTRIRSLQNGFNWFDPVLVESGNFYCPSLQQRMVVDEKVLTKVEEPLAEAPTGPLVLQLGHSQRPGLFGRWRSPILCSLPWTDARQHIRATASYSGDEAMTALAFSVAQQVLAHGGRVVLINPALSNPDHPAVERFDAQFFHAFPSMRWIRSEDDLWQLAALLDDDKPATGNNAIAMVCGDAAKLVVKQEGEFGKRTLNTAFQMINMCAFAKQLGQRGASQPIPDDFVPVVVIARHVNLDPSVCGINVADLGDANIGILQLDPDCDVPVEQTAFAKTILRLKENRSGFAGELRTKGDTLPTQFNYEGCRLAAVEELEAVREKMQQEMKSAGIFLPAAASSDERTVQQ